VTSLARRVHSWYSAARCSGEDGDRGAGRWVGGDNRLVSDKERESESRAVERLTIFSDAVVAIAITLLALDLPVPERDTVSAFWSSLRRNHGHYAAFLISFVVIAAAWGNHHDVFRYAKRFDPRLRTFNMAWLLTIVLVPVATRMLTAIGHPALDVHALRFGFYALLQVLESGALLAMLGTWSLTGRCLAPRGDGDRHDPAVLCPDGRLRTVDPALLRHDRCVAVVGHRPAGGGTGEPAPAPGRPRSVARAYTGLNPPHGRCLLRPRHQRWVRRGGHRARRRNQKDVTVA